MAHRAGHFDEKDGEEKAEEGSTEKAPVSPLKPFSACKKRGFRPLTPCVFFSPSSFNAKTEDLREDGL